MNIKQFNFHGEEGNGIKNSQEESLETKKENALAQYFELVRVIESLHVPKNINNEVAIKIDISYHSELIRIFRSYTQKEKTLEVLDSIQNTQPYPQECVLSYSLTKNPQDNIETSFIGASGDFEEKFIPIMDKLKGLLLNKGARISILPNRDFEFDGKSWQEIKNK